MVAVWASICCRGSISGRGTDAAGWFPRGQALQQPVKGGWTHGEKRISNGRNKAHLRPMVGEDDGVPQERNDLTAIESIRQMPELRKCEEERCSALRSAGTIELVPTCMRFSVTQLRANERMKSLGARYLPGTLEFSSF